MHALLGKINFKDITVVDLTSPKPERTQRILSAFIYLILLEEKNLRNLAPHIPDSVTKTANICN